MPKNRATLPNPYQVGSPARKYFFGRDELLDEMEPNIGSSSLSRQNYAVVGPRQIGKTSLVLRLHDRLCAKMPVSYLSLQKLESRDQHSLYREMLKPVKEQWGQSGYAPPTSGWATFSHIDHRTPADRFNEDMEALNEIVLETATIPRVVFILDEAEILQEIGGPSFLGFLRSIMQNLAGLCFVVVGSQLFSRMVQDYTSPFYNVFMSRALGHLSKPAACDLVREPVKQEWGIGYTDDAVERVVLQTGCHPHLIRLVCYEICEYIRKAPQITWIGEDTVQQVGTHLVQEWVPDLENMDYFSGIWETDPWSRLVMIVLAWADSPMRLKEITARAFKHLERTSVNPEPHTIRQAIHSLESRLVVCKEKLPTPWKSYLLLNDLLKEWIRVHCDLDRVLEELQVPDLAATAISPVEDLKSLDRVIQQRREQIEYLETRMAEAASKEEIAAISSRLNSERHELKNNLEQREELAISVESTGPTGLTTPEIDESKLPERVQEKVASLRRMIREAKGNLLLIAERESEYVLSTDLPLQLIKEKQRLREKLADLESRLAQIIEAASVTPQVVSSGYRLGLQRMKTLLAQEDRQVLSEFYTLEARLLELLEREDLFGGGETTRSERSRVIYRLNNLALDHLGISFNDLMLGREGTK